MIKAPAANKAAAISPVAIDAIDCMAMICYHP
jgi:hypothetical protein